MFIFSLRASSVKFFAILILTLAVLIGILVSGDTVLASTSALGEVDFSGVKTAEDRISFLESFGLKIKEGSEESVKFVMPENFDRVLMGYNEIQKSQGLDITKYAKKKVTRYTYELVDFGKGDGIAYASMFIYRNRIIALDVSSADPDGFVLPVIGFDK